MKDTASHDDLYVRIRIFNFPAELRSRVGV